MALPQGSSDHGFGSLHKLRTQSSRSHHLSARALPQPAAPLAVPLSLPDSLSLLSHSPCVLCSLLLFPPPPNLSLPLPSLLSSLAFPFCLAACLPRSPGFPPRRAMLPSGLHPARHPFGSSTLPSLLSPSPPPHPDPHCCSSASPARSRPSPPRAPLSRPFPSPLPSASALCPGDGVPAGPGSRRSAPGHAGSCSARAGAAGGHVGAGCCGSCWGCGPAQGRAGASAEASEPLGRWRQPRCGHRHRAPRLPEPPELPQPGLRPAAGTGPAQEGRGERRQQRKKGLG